MNLQTVALTDQLYRVIQNKCWPLQHTVEETGTGLFTCRLTALTRISRGATGWGLNGGWVLGGASEEVR